MEAKKIGILKNNTLERKEGNFEPSDSYVSNAKMPTPAKQTKKVGFDNQKESIKVSKSIKNELFALKKLTKTKFDYELIQLLVGYYTNSFSADKMKKYKFLLEIESDEE